VAYYIIYYVCKSNQQPRSDYLIYTYTRLYDWGAHYNIITIVRVDRTIGEKRYVYSRVTAERLPYYTYL